LLIFVESEDANVAAVREQRDASGNQKKSVLFEGIFVSFVHKFADVFACIYYKLKYRTKNNELHRQKCPLLYFTVQLLFT